MSAGFKSIPLVSINNRGRARLFLWLLASATGLACDAPKPHAYIPQLSVRELSAFGGDPSDVLQNGDQRLPRPAGGPLREGEEKPMLSGASEPGPKQEPGRRATGFRPDRVTELEGTLGYFEVFTPAITPFKRVSALDAVVLEGTTPVLAVSDPVRKRINVESVDTPAPDARPRDRFWGNVVLDFSEGHVVPLPSVSPESRILSVQTEPNVELHFEKDGADNFFAVSDVTVAGQVRVTYAMDAPRVYFGSALPSSKSDALQGELFGLPEKVSRDALTFARELGVSRGMETRDALAKLVEHFRGFTESKLSPRDTGNIFLDLARGKRGVCRHRAYGFVIVAQALGMPARFVQNEAHAWVEVKVPELGWERIDLGGAAEGLRTHQADDKPFYQPEVPDPWPRPEAYEESYSRAEQARAATAAGQVTRGNAGNRPKGATELKPTLSSKVSEHEEARLPDGRTPVLLSVTRYVPEVLRGTALEVEGQALLRSGAPVAGLRVEVSLSETKAARALLLGVSVTDEQGRFKGTFTVPPSIEPADYALVVVTPGDARHAAARAD